MQQQRIYRVGASTLTLQFGDITVSEADVLVSSDDSNLTMGGGVSAAIRRAAGQAILLEVAKKIPARLGEIVVTGAGALRAKHVFHAITIGKGEADTKQIVTGVTRRAIQLLRTLGLSSIAFPAIGTGAAGFEYEDVAVTMAEVIVEELQKSPDVISVSIYLFDRFGAMRPIDFLRFFEEFSIRSRLLTAAVARQSPSTRSTVKKPSTANRKKSEPEIRGKVLASLGELDRERQGLEGRLAQYGSALLSPDLKTIEARLKEIQGERIALLSTVNSKPASAVSVFVSYSHADETLRKELGKHLSVLERQGIIRTWHDRMIGAGTEWEGTIDKKLNESRVILLLISSDFIGSRYCYDIEMQRALERHARREALVVPIILRAVSLIGTPFSKLQALPKDLTPVVKWTDRDSAYVDITEGLRTAIQDLGSAGERKRRPVHAGAATGKRRD
jgi:O-acetyl-ADP-ribose deacetylase (regulator of RNase III)